jgi:hypothetical protein
MLKNMKASFDRIRSIVSICALSFILSCCSKGVDCHDPVSTNIDLNPTQKALVPYTGSETLIFYDSNGDTSYLIGQGVLHSYPSTQVSSSQGPDCPSSGEWKRAEVMLYRYYRDKAKSPFTKLEEVKMSNESYNGEHNINDNIFISFNGGATCSYWGGEFVTPHYSDVVHLTTGTYATIRSTSTSSSGGPFLPDTFFYHPTYGLLQIIQHDSTVWKRKF